MTVGVLVLDLIRDVAAVLGIFGVVGGAAVALAYWLFKQFAQGWLKARFDKDLAQFKAAKDLELVRLRAEISRLADRATHFHEKEYEVLPEAWGLLNEAHGAVSAAVIGFQQLPDLDRMSDARFTEFLERVDLRQSEKDEISASNERNRTYAKMDRWRMINEGNRAQAKFNNYVILQGVFIENDIAEKMSAAAQLLRGAIVAAQIIGEGSAGDLHKKMFEDLQNVQPIIAEIKEDVKKRLWAIQLKDV